MQAAIAIAILTAFCTSLSAESLGELTSATAIVICLAFSAGANGWKHGAFSPISIIFASSAMYLVSPAIGLLADINIPLIDPALYFDVALPIGLVYLFVLSAAYGLLRRKNSNSRRTPFRIPSSNRMLFIGVLAIGGALLYMLSIYVDLGTVGVLSRGDLQLTVSTRTRILSFLVLAGALFGVASFVEGKRVSPPYPTRVVFPFVIGLALFAYVSVFVLGDRRLLLSALAAILAILPLTRRQKSIAIFATVPLYLSFSLYSAFRNTPASGWKNIYDSINPWAFIDPSRGEFGGWARIAQDVLSKPFGEIWRLTTLELPLAVVPSALLPDRPVAPSVWYVNTFDPLTAARGGGFAFSIVVESFMNFWWVGPILLGFGIAWLIARFENTDRLRVIAVFVLAFSFRLDGVSLVQMFGWMIVFMGMYDLIARLRLKQ
jgi:hypothetical protein